MFGNASFNEKYYILCQKFYKNFGWLFFKPSERNSSKKLCRKLKSSYFWGQTGQKSAARCLLTSSSNVLPLHLKQTFPPIIWIFTEGEGEGDGIESRQPFKNFSTLK